MAPSITPVNPFTGEALAAYPLASPDELRERAAAARLAFSPWREKTVPERVEAVEKALVYFERNRGQIAKDITLYMGKPIVQSEREIDTFFERARYLLGAAEDALRPESLPPKDGFHRAIEHVPLGVVLVISAWNYPLLISVNGVATALLSGNAVLLKHSGKTPVIGEHFARAFGALGGVDGVLQSIDADHASLAALIEGGGVDHVIFTGSVKGGREIQRSAAACFIDCNLELGGKDAAYVAADADARAAAEGVVDGAMYNAGQSCCGIERVYVHRGVYNDFLDRADAFCENYLLGDPLERGTTMGPLADPGSADAMERQVDDALARGARLVRGGRRWQIDKAVYFPPTILADVPQDALIMQEENFGPILPVAPVENDEEALARVNDSAYGLTCAIYTRSRERARRFARGAETGTVFMNRCDYLDPALPWTGVKDSGRGSALSRYGFLALTRRKSLNFRLG